MDFARYLADVVVTCDDAGNIYSPGIVEVTGGVITWVGPESDAPEFTSSGIIHDIGGLLMPGLVNSHCHTPMTLVRGAGDGLPLERWLTEAMWPREGRMSVEDVWWGMTLGSAEMLKSGITTSCEMYLFEESVVDAVAKSGARLVMTPGVLSTLHSQSHGKSNDRLKTLMEFYDRYHDPSSRITVGIAPHSAYDLGIHMCRELSDLARSLDTILHIHLAETQEESKELEEQYGKSITKILLEEGVFDGQTLAAHCVWVDDSDISLLANANVSVAHCPVSNMKLGSGIAPLVKMIVAGITVGLGTDGPASNDTLDLWEEVKVAALLARVVNLDSTLITPMQALNMATCDAAKAVGLDNVGSLTEGFAADMIRIDLNHSCFTPITETNELLAHLVWAGSNRRVTDVWVEGEQVVVHGDLKTVDEEKAQAEVNERAMRLVQG